VVPAGVEKTVTRAVLQSTASERTVLYSHPLEASYWLAPSRTGVSLHDPDSDRGTEIGFHLNAVSV
jgi:hypothetical protein